MSTRERPAQALRKPKHPPSAGGPGAGQGWATALAGDHVLLLPGQLYFGGAAATVSTLLGSCVAITLWHPQRRLGGMCHYLLPSRVGPAAAEPDARFGDEALALLVARLRQAGSQPRDYQAHMYGGADTRPGALRSEIGVGVRNIEQGWRLIDHHGFQLLAVDVGEHIPRQVRLDLRSGAVAMRRGAPMAPMAPMAPRG